MIKVKNLFDGYEDEDGVRLWVEHIGLTKDLIEWCRVDHLLCPIAPPAKLSHWFARHPEAYDEFRGRYHRWLGSGTYGEQLQQLADTARDADITLLHTSDDASHNAGTALAEYLSELQGWKTKA
jgi:uncharacterized protein YeaO (DUF488 family)